MNCSGERFVRIRRKVKKYRRVLGKPPYKHQKLELTIPSRFKDVVEPFLNKDLRVEAKRHGNKIVIEAAPAENTL
jgi:hypothetical protein